MAKQGKITTIMLKDHGKIIKLLKDLESISGSKKESDIELFNTFKWELERHFVVEEIAIFKYYEPSEEEEYKMVPKLLKDHKTIKDELGFIKEEAESTGKVDISGIQELLKEHKMYEEEEFYPTLERILSSSQKKKIIDQIEQQI